MAVRRSLPFARENRVASRRLGVESLEARRLLTVVPGLLKDINPAGSSTSGVGIEMNGLFYFVANDGTHGKELWKSDGTTLGTVQIKDINPAGDSVKALAISQRFGNEIFFGAEDNATGYELWKTDGSELGTVLVKDINPTGNGNPSGFITAGSKFFFLANDGTNGQELWTTDGTTGGTFMVKDINPGSLGSSIQGTVAINGLLYFSATSAANGSELWRSDGTTVGTYIVKDINPGSGSGQPSWITNLNGTLLFSATNGTSGLELWRSDGTDVGTTLVKDINPGGVFSQPFGLTVWNGQLYFSANDGTHGIEIWKSDGTTDGTSLLKDINPNLGNGVLFFTPVVANSMIYFTGNDGTHGPELWNTDGTAVGTEMLADINPGSSGSIPTVFGIAGDRVFFRAGNGTYGGELWTSDGTPAGTDILLDIIPGSATSDPSPIQMRGSELIFAATDLDHGRELWRSNGTPAGTTMIADINPGTSSSSPTLLGNANGAIYFKADDGVTGVEPWVLPADPVYSNVVGRAIFYNNSKFDGNGNNGAGISTSDDLAVATDKSAYLPGVGASTFANMTSFNKGINGVMVDLSGPHAATLSASDFVFRVGNNNTPSGWVAAPAPTAISIRPGAGTSGSDRVEITWADGAIKNQWLQVIVDSGANTGLADLAGYPAGQGDVFFFGNKIGNVPLAAGGDSASFAVVGANDQLEARGHLGLGAQRSNVYDFDRNKVVDANDELIARGNAGNLRFIVVASPPLAPDVNALVLTEMPFAAPLAGVPSGEHGDAGIASGLAASVAVPLRTTSVRVAGDILSPQLTPTRATSPGEGISIMPESERAPDLVAVLNSFDLADLVHDGLLDELLSGM